MLSWRHCEVQDYRLQAEQPQYWFGCNLRRGEGMRLAQFADILYAQVEAVIQICISPMTKRADRRMSE
jgi:hypothetical protein